MQEIHMAEDEFPLFSATVFGAAAITGIVYILIKSLKKPLKFNARNILGGIVLGVPNYFSVFFLLRPFRKVH